MASQKQKQNKKKKFKPYILETLIKVTNFLNYLNSHHQWVTIN